MGGLTLPVEATHGAGGGVRASQAHIWESVSQALAPEDHAGFSGSSHSPPLPTTLWLFLHKQAAGLSKGRL